MKQGFDKPSSVLGILGGGQLGRMFVMSAHAMGYQVAVLDPDENSPAGSISEYHIKANYDNEPALDKLIDLCEVVSTEFENVSSKVMEYLEAKIKVHPSAKAVSIAQNRIKEKNYFKDKSVATTDFISVTSELDFKKANKLSFPCVLKKAEFGYDGKGQKVCQSIKQAINAFNEMQCDCILEQMVDLEKEVSVILARSYDANIVYFPIAENQHKDGILELTIVPANINKEVEQQVLALAEKIANGIGYVGVLAIEFFITKDRKVLVNEMAPRPHNSGHYTMNACTTSQFDQQVRTMAHLPLANINLISPAVMINLLGDCWLNDNPRWDEILKIKSTFLHLYGKKEAKSGRKMGHINVLAKTTEEALQTAKKVMALL